MVDPYTVLTSPTLAINERMRTIEEAGGEVFKFGFGQSPFPIPELVVETLKTYAHQKAYLPVQGLPALRENISHLYSKKYSHSISPDQIIIGPGSKELIYTLIHSISGDILLPSPSWVSYEPQAKMSKKNIVWISADLENNWIISAKAFDQACRSTKNKKLFILNYPNNPTGSIPTADQVDEIIEVAKKHQVIILHDNIYGRLDHSLADQPFYSKYPEGTIISSGLSKWCGAGGWRFGFHIFPTTLSSLKSAVLHMASETFSCVSAPIQYAAVTAFKDDATIDEYLLKCKSILGRISDYVYGRLLEMGTISQPSSGGFYFFPIFSEFEEIILRNNITTSQVLCERILSETGVALLPGSVFGRPEKEFSVRLAYVDFDGKGILNDYNAHPPLRPEAEFISTFCPKIEKGLLRLNAWFDDL